VNEIKRWADASACERYRYVLFRGARAPRRLATFILRNPPPIDYNVADPEILRCQEFTEKWGCDGMIVLYAFAMRAREFSAIANQTRDWAVGPDAWSWFYQHFAVKPEGPVVCGWGEYGDTHGRAGEILRWLDEWGIDSYALGFLTSGQPRTLYASGIKRPLVPMKRPNSVGRMLFYPSTRR